MAQKQMPHLLQLGEKTDVGRVRTENQDACGHFVGMPQDDKPAVHLYVVADGMGGHADGRIASSTAVSTIGEAYFSRRVGSVLTRLEHAFQEANLNIHKLLKDLPGGQIMGTTCTALLVEGDRVFVAHVGDSRLYRIRPDKAEQISEDHTMISAMVKKGILTPQEAERHPQRSMLERALGPEPHVEVDTFEIDRLHLNDVYVLCSDGLGDVHLPEISEIVQAMPPQEAAEKMVVLANERGGLDNSTVQVIRVAPSDKPIEYVTSTASFDAQRHYQKAHPTVATGVWNALEQPEVWRNDRGHAVLPPPPEAKDRPKWLIPLISGLVMLIVVGAVWFNLDLLNRSKSASVALQNEPYNENAYSNTNPVTEPETPKAAYGTQDNVAPLISDNPLSNGSKPSALPGITPPITRDSKPEAARITTKPKENPVSNKPDPFKPETEKPQEQGKDGAKLASGLADAWQNLQAGNHQAAVSRFIALESEFGKTPEYREERSKAAKKLMSLGDGKRATPATALDLYRKSQQLLDSETIQSRITEIQKMETNN
ncbi:MAG: serine/threonine-protein phosphatase [Bacteroidetes Order II. Incertae sedis bacterium]|nr:serine/threonine-protein phosphatase [Bacteroidetes Order II. bacterium]